MADDTAIPGRPGRKSKGERRLINFRLPIEKADLAREIATYEGFEYMSDWVAMAVTEYMEKLATRVDQRSTATRREG